MIAFFQQYLYEPLLSLLIYLYRNFSFGDFGVAVILLTIIIRFVLFPLFYKSAKDQAIMQKIAPRLKEIQRLHKQDKEKQVQATMELYREHKVNPFSSFLLLLLQTPVMIVLFFIFSRGFKNIGDINTNFLGFFNLAQPSILLVVLSALVQYWQSSLTLPKSQKKFYNLSTEEQMGKMMIFMGPAMTVFIFWRLPSAVALYLLTTTAISVVQQMIINKRLNIKKEIKKEEEKLEATN